MSRKIDRKHAFKLVFQIPFHQTFNCQEVMDRYFEGVRNAEEIDKNFVELEFFGVYNSLNEIDERINKAASGWEISRLSKIDLAIMRLAVFELLYNKEIPKRVTLNEAIEFGKAYSTPEAPAFINGVLGKIASDIGE